MRVNFGKKSGKYKDAHAGEREIDNEESNMRAENQRASRQDNRSPGGM